MSWPVDKEEAPGDGAYMIVPGEEARAIYEPTSDQDPLTWHFQGWIGGTPGTADPDIEDLIVEWGTHTPPPADAAELLTALDEIATEMEDGE